jgi:hypothetical protein
LSGTHSLQVIGNTAASTTNGVIRATNTGNGTAIYGRADGTGYGVIGSAASGVGVRGGTTNNVGVFGIATTGIGGQFLTGGNYAISGLTNYSSTNTMEYVATFYRSSSGTVANGMGAGLRFSLEDSLDTNIEAGTHGFRWTNVGNRDTRWELNTINANTTNRRIMIDHDGELTLDGYTTNNFIGTGWGRLAVTAGGLIVVDTTSGGGGTMDDWTIAGDAGTPQVVSDAETATIAGGYGINTSAAATRTVTVTADTAQLATVSALADTAAAIRGSLNTHLVYVSTVGDDANSGLSISEAKLTISAAITVASGLISGGASGVKVHVLDGATYTENIVVPPNVVVWAPGATLVGTVAVASRGEATFDQIYATANNQNLVSMDAAGTGPGIITANIIDGRGLSGTLTGVKGVRNTGGGGKNLFAHIGLLYVGEDGVGVGDVSSGNAGHIHLFCKDLYLAGNNAIGVLGSAQGAGSTNIVGWIDHILEISTPTATTGIKMDAPGAILKIIASEIIADTAYSISSGDLHIVVPRISGERVGTPAFESSNQKSYLNLLRLNLAADLPTRLLGADSDGDVGETTIGAGLQIVAGELSADTAQLATQYDLTILDHGALTGLTDDDHTQYALLAGRATGQVLTGGTASGDDLTLRSTTDATKGDIIIADQGGNVTVGGGATATELRFLEPSGSGSNYTAFKAQAQAGNVTYTLPAADGANGDALKTNGSGVLSWGDVVHNTLTTDSLANDTLLVDFASVQNHIYQVDMTSAESTVEIIISNPVEAGVYTFDFSDVTGTQTIIWPSNVKDLNRIALGTVTYSGPFMKTMYYDGTDYITPPDFEPAVNFDRDSITSTTLTIDLEYNYQGIHEIDMTSATSLTLTISNPSQTGVYTFHFFGVSGTDNVTWPANFYDMNNTALGTDALTVGTAYTCYYNPHRSNYYCK